MFLAFGLRTLRISAAIIAALAINTSAISASTPTTASGTFGPTGAPASITFRAADGNTIVTITARPGAFTGTFVGTYSEDLRIVIHSDQSTNFAAQLTWRCTVEGRTGTFTLKLDGTGDPTPFAAHRRIVGATGGLPGLHGEGTLAAPPPPDSRQLHLDSTRDGMHRRPLHG